MRASRWRSGLTVRPRRFGPPPAPRRAVNLPLTNLLEAGQALRARSGKARPVLANGWFGCQGAGFASGWDGWTKMECGMLSCSSDASGGASGRGQVEGASRRRPVGGGQPAGGQSGALAWRPACIRLVETVKSATMPRSVCHVLRPGDSRFGRADSLSQHAAIVSRDLIFFALSAFLTKFTPVLTSFSRALWSIVHDSFCVLRFPGIVQDQGFRAWRVHLCTGWRVRWSVPSC